MAIMVGEGRHAVNFAASAGIEADSHRQSAMASRTLPIARTEWPDKK
jgi:hypothetical protein